ncbi:hypothetical protein VARIO8X_20068 [Burkholderiales bacterium 8X]|nr:hypothetical protein VARIO8X_20068 [Burkholderiales bacterium 8X]
MPSLRATEISHVLRPRSFSRRRPAGPRHQRPLPGAPRLLRRPQLRSACARNGLRPRPRAAFLLLQAERRCVDRAGARRRDRRHSVSAAHQQLSLRGRAGGDDRQGRPGHRSRCGRRAHLRLRGRAGHDPARPADEDARARPSVGDRQGLRLLGTGRAGHAAQPVGQHRPGRDHAQGGWRGPAAKRHPQPDLVGRRGDRQPVDAFHAAAGRPDLHRHARRRRRGEARPDDRGRDRRSRIHHRAHRLSARTGAHTMDKHRGTKPSVLLIGGGIGGMSAALALARLGMPIELLEQSAAIGEIGAGLQLGPNAFAALDALGVGEAVRRNAVFTDRLVMMDAVDCGEVASVPVGEAFRERFGNPYAVSHRADLHGAIHEAVKQHPLIRFHTSAQVESLDLGGAGGRLQQLPSAVLLPHHGRDRRDRVADGQGNGHAGRQRQHHREADQSDRHGRGPALRHPRRRPHRGLGRGGKDPGLRKKTSWLPPLPSKRSESASRRSTTS